MLKAYKYRIYPNKYQQEQIQYNFNGKRFVWNHFLALNKDRLNNKEFVLTLLCGSLPPLRWEMDSTCRQATFTTIF